MSELLARTASLIDIPSVSRNEYAIADVVEQTLRPLDGLEVVRVDNNVIARTNGNKSKRLVLGGHLDTVPPAGNESSRIDGTSCYGCGSADMKGGIAVLLELAKHAHLAMVDLTFVFYACEEIARTESGLLAIAAYDAELLNGDAAVLLEPTGAFIEAGCQGVVRAIVNMGGVRAHSARPWVGTNAVHRLAPVIERIAQFEDREPTIDGCRYHESMQVVRVGGGIATNVVPDAAHIEISYRFAPDQHLTEAIATLQAYLSPTLDESFGDYVEIVDAAPAAVPALSNEVLEALTALSGKPPRAKLGWTDVAFFGERGIPATNFGPGDPELAHSPGEFVTAEDLDAVYESLSKLVLGG